MKDNKIHSRTFLERGVEQKMISYKAANLQDGVRIRQWNMFQPWVYSKPFEAQINPFISWMQCCLILKYPPSKAFTI